MPEKEKRGPTNKEMEVVKMMHVIKGSTKSNDAWRLSFAHKLPKL